MTTLQRTDPAELSHLPLPPGSSGFPLMGETLAFLRSPNALRAERRRHGNVFRTHLLAQHPEVLQRCREEQQGAALEEPLTLERLRELSFLNQVVQEGLRLQPPAGGVMRTTTQDVEFGGYRIPKGWQVILAISATHLREPWTEPRRFDPDRMGPERAEHKQQPHCHIRFGGGARVCLGQHFALAEMGIVLSLLLRGYRWELVPGQDLSIVPLPFPHPRSGIQVHFSRL